MKPKSDLPQGTLDLLILKVVALGPIHGYAIAQRLEQVSRGVVQVPQGSLYPALHRLENRSLLAAEWKLTETGREGKFYRVRDLTIDPKPAQLPHPPIWIGGGTQPSEKVYGQTVPNIDPVLRRIAKYADTWVPHSSSTPEQVKGDWTKVQGFAREAGRDPAKISRVYSNFVWVVEPGEKPESAVPHFSVYSGMDLEYWKTYYLLGEAADVADRISARIAALDGGVDTIVLNPLDWSPRQLELIAGDVLPKVKTTR